MSSIVFLNGDFCKEEDAKVSIFDRGYLFGDGIYEVVPVINGKVIDKAPFFERFDASLSKIALQAPFCKAEIITILDTLIAKNDLKEGGIYMQVTRGVAPREFYFPENTPTTFMAFVFHKAIIDAPLAKTGVKVVSCEDIRWKRRDIKSISLLGQVLAKEEVHQKGRMRVGWLKMVMSQKVLLRRRLSLKTVLSSHVLYPMLFYQAFVESFYSNTQKRTTSKLKSVFSPSKKR